MNKGGNEMIRVGIYTGKVYYGVGDDPKECCVMGSNEKELKARALLQRSIACRGCTDCEEAKKDGKEEV